MASIFGTFNTARTGLTAHQSAINVTSHNIANSSTVGYSRQRVKIITARPISIGGEAGQVGTGAQIAAIERVRDSFLDYQVRVETSELGKYSAKSEYLSQVESIFNEPSDTGISTSLSEFFDAFQELSKQSTSSSTRAVVAQKSKALCDILNNTYTKLEKLQQDSKDEIKSSVKAINSLLEQLTTINDQIRIASISGDNPNDLMDSRDVILDELSAKFGIDIDKKQFNGNDVTGSDLVGVGLNPLVNSSPNGEVTRLGYVTNVEIDAAGNGKVTYYINGDTSSDANKVEINIGQITEKEADEIRKSGIILTDGEGKALTPDGKNLNGTTKAYGGVATGGGIIIFSPSKGEVAGNIEIQDSIQNYMNQLDNLAKGLAYSVNAIHSGSLDSNLDITQGTVDFFVNSADNSNETGISAKNISINLDILKDPSLINTKTNADSGEGDGARALAIAKLQGTLIAINKVNVPNANGNIMTRREFLDGKLSADGLSIENDVANGTKVESYFQDLIDKLGVEAQYANRIVANEEELLISLDLNRLSVSGVSLDEEMTNLIQFQKAYSANAKTITTVSEMLDVILGLI